MGKKAKTINLNITHGRIFRRYWGSILVTLGLILISATLWLMQPYLLGRAIDDLTSGQWRGVAYLAGLQVLVLMIGASRRFYDTRVYTRIYKDIGEETVTASQQADVPLTRMTARANMLREVVRFFEFRVPATLRSFINLVGSLGLLYFLSVPVFLACLGGVVFIAITSAIFSGAILRVNAKLNDQLEEEVDVFASRSNETLRGHLSTLAGHQVRRSDLQVLMFGLNNIGMMGVLLFSLYQVVSVEQAAIGVVFSVFSYVTRFQNAVEQFPSTYVELLRTVEITRRINAVEVAEDTGEAPTTTTQKPPKEKPDEGSAQDERQSARLIQYLSDGFRL